MVASGGALAAMVIGAAGDAGGTGLIGALVARWLGEEYAEDLRQPIDRGGLVPWMHARDAEHEKRSVGIMTRSGARDVHAHDLAVARPAPL